MARVRVMLSILLRKVRAIWLCYILLLKVMARARVMLCITLNGYGKVKGYAIYYCERLWLKLG